MHIVRLFLLLSLLMNVTFLVYSSEYGQDFSPRDIKAIERDLTRPVRISDLAKTCLDFAFSSEILKIYSSNSVRDCEHEIYQENKKGLIRNHFDTPVENFLWLKSFKQLKSDMNLHKSLRLVRASLSSNSEQTAIAGYFPHRIILFNHYDLARESLYLRDHYVLAHEATHALYSSRAATQLTIGALSSSYGCVAIEALQKSFYKSSKQRQVLVSTALGCLIMALSVGVKQLSASLQPSVLASSQVYGAASRLQEIIAEVGALTYALPVRKAADPYRMAIAMAYDRNSMRDISRQEYMWKRGGYLTHDHALYVARMLWRDKRD